MLNLHKSMLNGRAVTLSKSEFFAKIAPYAVRAMKEDNVLASLIMAQAALESAYGQIAPGNMLFGIKAGSSWTGTTQLLWTHEVYGGKRVRVQAKFRSYPSWYESLKDHTRLFTKYPRYKGLLGLTDYKKACREVQASGYATDPEYANKLIQIIESNNLFQYDKESDPVLSVDIANEVIKNFYQVKYAQAKTDAERTAIGKKADALRVVSGQKVQNS